MASLDPNYSFWWTPFPNWAVRGSTGPIVPTNHAPTSGYSSYINSLAIGRYFKGSDDGWIQQLWFYLVANESSVICGPRPRESAFSLQPGLRAGYRSLTMLARVTGTSSLPSKCPWPAPSIPMKITQTLYAFLYDY